MSEPPDISIIIPARNEGENIRKCLDSVTKLDYTNNKIEIIVVDNGSTDDTASIAKTYDGVKVLSKEAGTIGSIRNYGVANALGKIIAFLDADSVPDKNWIKKGTGYLRENESVSCVGFNMTEPTANSPWVERTWYKMGSGSQHKGVCEVEWLSSFNLILRKDMFEEVGGFDESLETCEDADLGHKLAVNSKLLFSDELTVEHLGNAKTIKQFFFKELWRGKNNLNSYVKSKNKLGSLPSVFIPLIYTLALFTFIVVITLQVMQLIKLNLPVSIALASVILLFPMYLTTRKEAGNVYGFFQITTLYFIYLVARGIAVLGIRAKGNT